MYVYLNLYWLISYFTVGEASHDVLDQSSDENEDNDNFKTPSKKRSNGLTSVSAINKKKLKVDALVEIKKDALVEIKKEDVDEEDEAITQSRTKKTSNTIIDNSDDGESENSDGNESDNGFGFESDNDADSDSETFGLANLVLILALMKSCNGKQYTTGVLYNAEDPTGEESKLKNSLYTAAREELPTSQSDGKKNTTICFLKKEFGLVFGCLSEEEKPEKTYMYSTTRPDGRLSAKFFKKLIEKDQQNFMTMKKDKVNSFSFQTEQGRTAFKEKFEARFNGKVEIDFKVYAL